MQIENKYSYSTLPSSTATSLGTTVAQQHVSLFPTRLALARWTRGGDIPHVHASERSMPMRAAWYAQSQRHFMAWLEAGGFHHQCPECALREEGLGRANMLDASANAAEHAALTYPAHNIGICPAPEDKR